MSSPTLFFHQIAPLSEFEGIVDGALYTDAPADWWVLLTDVVSSTAQIDHGRYREVNAAAVAFLVAALNASQNPAGIPFTFGGDGVTLIIPPADKDAIQSASSAAQQMVRQTFALEMRVGFCPVSLLVKQGFPVRVAKYGLDGGAAIACLSGEGIIEAERLLKSGALENLPPEGNSRADFSGFSCQWLPVSASRGLVVALLVKATADDPTKLPGVYRELLRRLGAIVGDWRRVHPVAPLDLEFGGMAEASKRELPIRTFNRSPLVKSAITFATRIASSFQLLGIQLRRISSENKATAAQREISANCDWRKFDGCFKAILGLTVAEADAIRSTLEQARAEGLCSYGLHTSNSALITCFVKQGQGQAGNLHFIDANDGGYAIAAKMLKAQLRA